MNSVTVPAFKPSERRRAERLPAKNIDVLIKSQRTEPNSFDFGKVASVDFNRHGVGLIAPHCYSIGDEVELLIQGRSGTAEVHGVVCNRAREDKYYRCGIAFKPVSEQAYQLLMGLELHQDASPVALIN